MVSCRAVFQEFVTGTNTPCAAPDEPQVALLVMKVTESAKVMVMVIVALALPDRPASVLPETDRRFVPAVRPLIVAVSVLIVPSV